MPSSSDIRSKKITRNEIVNSLSTFTNNDLNVIRLNIQMELDDREKGGRSVETEDWLLHGVSVELDRRGIDFDSRFFKIKDNRSFHGYKGKAIKIRAYLEDKAPGLSLVERRTLGEIAARELAAYIETWPNMAITRDKLLEHIDRIPQALERGFPSYLRNGMLIAVIRQHF